MMKVNKFEIEVATKNVEVEVIARFGRLEIDGVSYYYTLADDELLIDVEDGDVDTDFTDEQEDAIVDAIIDADEDNLDIVR